MAFACDSFDQSAFYTDCTGGGGGRKKSRDPFGAWPGEESQDARKARIRAERIQMGIVPNPAADVEDPWAFTRVQAPLAPRPGPVDLAPTPSPPAIGPWRSISPGSAPYRDAQIARDLETLRRHDDDEDALQAIRALAKTLH